MRSAFAIIDETISAEQARGGLLNAHALIDALTSEGWHLVSPVTEETRDDPPMPDDAVRDTVRYAAASFPQRITRLSVHVDGTLISSETSIHRYGDIDPGYQAAARSARGRELACRLGGVLGVPGCESHR